MAARKRTVVALTALVAALATAGTASAADFTVNTTADTNDAQGCLTLPTCSLREAIARSNVSMGDDTVAVPAGRYTLTLGSLTMASGDDITINGAGTRTTVVDAGGQSRVFNLGNGGYVIRDLTVTGGTAPAAAPVSTPGDGGGILVESVSLRLERVAVVGNTAELNGGGVSAPPEGVNSTDVTIVDSTIANNTVTGGAIEGQGGGLYLSGTATLTNVTVSGNSVSNPGANVGGGIAAIKNTAAPTPTTVTLQNTTVAGNSVTTGMGGGFSAGNPAGTQLATLSSTNSIVAGNTGGDCTLNGAMLAVTSDHSLSGDASCGFADAGSIQSTDPKLGALADNGGPTDTRALLDGSPAFDAGTGTGCPAADQRGTSRAQAKVCDIGAYELVPRADLAVSQATTPDSVITGERATFAVTVTNNGPQPAAGVRLTDVLPARADLVSGAEACTGAPLACPLPDLAPGESRTISLTVATREPGTLTNSATVSGDYADPEPANNTAPGTLVVRSLADLRISQKVSHRLLRKGERVVFTLTVENQGPNRATGVRIYNRMSDRLRFRKISGTRGCTGGDLKRCTLRPIASGKSRKVEVIGRARSGGRARNNAEAFSTVEDPQLRDNRAVAAVRVLRPARASRLF